MGRGRYAEAATYEGSEKVLGVVVGPEDLEIHIVARLPVAKADTRDRREHKGARGATGRRAQNQGGSRGPRGGRR